MTKKSDNYHDEYEEIPNDRQKYQQNDTVTPNATAQNILFLKYLPRSY